MEGETHRVRIRSIAELTVLEEASESERESEDEPDESVSVEVPDTRVMIRRAGLAAVFTPAQRVEFGVDALKVGADYPVLVGELARRFADAVEEVPTGENSAVTRISRFVAQYPSLLATHVPDLRDLSRVSEPIVSRRAAWYLMSLAEHEPRHVLDAVPTLAVVLESDDTETRR